MKFSVEESRARIDRELAEIGGVRCVRKKKKKTEGQKWPLWDIQREGGSSDQLATYTRRNTLFKEWPGKSKGGERERKKERASDVILTLRGERKRVVVTCVNGRNLEKKETRSVAKLLSCYG